MSKEVVMLHNKNTWFNKHLICFLYNMHKAQLDITVNHTVSTFNTKLKYSR